MGQIKPGTKIKTGPKKEQISDAEYQDLLQMYPDLIAANTGKSDVQSAVPTNCKTSDDYLRELETGEYETRADGDSTGTDEKPEKPGKYSIPEKYRDRSLFKGRPKHEKEWVYEPKTKSDTTEWSTYFRTPRTVDEIRQKIFFDYDNVCFSYLCSWQKIPESFIPELMALSTGLLNAATYDAYKDDVMKAVLVLEGIEEGTIDLGILPVNRKLAENMQYGQLTDRLDWSALNQYQDLSPAFRKKYAPLLTGSPQSAGYYVSRYQKKARQS